MSDLRTRLAAIPDPAVTRRPEIDRAIAHSVEYLGSDAAQRSLDTDTYWPKWNSPWWHMLLLFELDEARRIPERAVSKMVEGLNALRIKIFPIHPGDTPSGADAHRDSSCHCGVGSIYQILSACGVDVDRAVPWIPPWFVHYQMADGGLNCDSGAYLVDECASSMVATVPLFEAMLARRDWTLDERIFVERAASFLIDRKLMHGSRSTYNAEERDAAPAWLEPCFPRFYLYDVLRGLVALTRWAELGNAVPLDAISPVIEHLLATFPNGVIRVQRQAHAGMMTRVEREGVWVREPASTFPLLDATGVLGEPSEALTRRWSATRRVLARLY
jgi:hypothetical protein